jgi:hypothetical protein
MRELPAGRALLLIYGEMPSTPQQVIQTGSTILTADKKTSATITLPHPGEMAKQSVVIAIDNSKVILLGQSCANLLSEVA